MNPTILTITATIAGMTAGASLVWFLLQKHSQQSVQAATATAEERQKAVQEQLAEKIAVIQRLEAHTAARENELSELRSALARAEERQQSALRAKEDGLKAKDEAMAAQLRLNEVAYRAQLQEKQDAIDEQKRLMNERLTEAFASLSSKTLTEVSKQFLDLANEKLNSHQKEAKGELEQRKQAIDELLKPLRENLDKIERHGHEIESKRELAYKTIEDHVLRLMGATDHLSNALRKPHVRGNWGEMTLRTVVESAGMQDGVHFVVQDSTETDGGVLRPDMVVTLPKSRRIALDSKAPLDAFREAVNCEDETERERLFKRHAAAVRGHMKSLSDKRYWQQYEGLGLVIMFLPSEAMFLTAVQHDIHLLEDARAQKICLANPSTLMASLSAVAYILDQERLNDNALEISKIGRMLHDGVRVFAGHMDKVGRNLRLSVDAYNASVKSLESRVLSRSRKLSEMGLEGEDAPAIDEVASLPIGFQSQELIAGGTELVNESPMIAYGDSEPAAIEEIAHRQRTQVQSSQMRSIGYDSTTEILEIELRNGNILQFDSVPAFVHEELMSATSHGTYYDKHIRERYPKRRRE